MADKIFQLTRREALLASLGLAAYATLPKASSTLFAQSLSSTPTPLKTAGARLGCQIGTATDKQGLQDEAIAQFVVRNFNLLTASGMKWGSIHPGPDTYDFTEADWNVSFAEKNGMRVHGHNLCWNVNNPPWLKSVLNKTNAKQILTSHITTVMKRYQGRIDSWDVVNEPVVPWPGRSDGLYPGTWVDILGPEYLDIAFHAAALADPKPLRILNIHHVEQGTSDDELTRTRALVLLKQLVARGVPIQAVGFESHLDASKPLGQTAFTEFIKQIRGLGLEVLVTELDVKEDRTKGGPPDWDRAVGNYYGSYITEVLSVAKPRFLILWSVADRWENGSRIEGLSQNRWLRSSYQAVLAALQNSSK